MARGLSVILLLIVAVALGGCGEVATPTVRVSRPATTSIIYYVEGTDGVNRASLTYENEQGGTEQLDAPLPWRLVLTVKPGQFVYVAAQNTSGVNGGISCEIVANTTSFKKSQSRGVAVIASCSGSAP